MSEPTVNAATLAGAYMAMAQLFSYPSAESRSRLVEQGLIDPALPLEDLEAEYLAAFEVGRDGPAVPLFEGMHRGETGRDGIVEDLLRFYEFFDVKLDETNREYPDHLVTELEFVAWLCMQEQAAAEKGDDPQPFRLAARDFLVRHLAAWLPEFLRKLKATDTVYGQYGPALEELVALHRGRLGEQIQESGEGQ